MNIIIFEDDSFNQFYPISLTRPIWELRVGCFLQRERIEKIINKIFNKANENKFYYFTRDYLQPFYKEKYSYLNINDYSFLESGKDAIIINSRIIPDERISGLQKNTIYTSNNTLLLAHVDNEKLKKEKTENIRNIISNSGIEIKDGSFLKKFEFIWDLIKLNNEMIGLDFALLDHQNGTKLDSSIALIGDGKNCFIGPNVVIDPFVCIDVSNGPVIIEEGARINSFSRIEGPCYIGRKCIILGAKIREGCSFGDFCRIGGEVEESIFHSYSNKYHDGFIGHSYVGEWVNLGALTTNSDLKNNYTEVKVYIPDRRKTTGSIKMGSFIGDFTKTSIGSLIFTGASMGVGSMIVHSGKLCPHHIPSFTWYIDGAVKNYSPFDDFIETCKVQTKRRNVDFTGNYEILLKSVFDLTLDNREKEVAKWKGKMK